MQGAATRRDAGHREGAATPQIAGRRRNPSGSNGLRPGASLRLVTDEPASPSSSRLARGRNSLLRGPREFLRSLLVLLCYIQLKRIDMEFAGAIVKLGCVSSRQRSK